MFMNLICWLAVGLIAGLIASKFVDERGDDPKLGITLAGAGAVVGGFLYGIFGKVGVNEFNSGALWIAAIGAAGALMSWHGFRHFASRT
jgi:uncharacterized membrane protein YeaQ/YmgE (transglycosylase-associated protein family)